MIFATVIAPMIRTPENPIPKMRTALTIETAVTPPDPIVTFLENDPDWLYLEKHFQTLVSTTASEVYHLNSDDLFSRAEELDQEAPNHPYLGHAVKHEGSLTTISAAMTDIFKEPIISEHTTFAIHSPEKTLRIFFAGRLLGQRLADTFDWNSKHEFGEKKPQAELAMSLCKKAITAVPSRRL